MCLDSLLNQIRQALNDEDARVTLRACKLSRKSVLEDVDELLARAHKEIHIFPLSSVPPHWFKLYTDASLAKAVDLLIGSASTKQTGLRSDKSQLEEVVGILDKALIIAGGLGREATIHSLLQQLGIHASKIDKDVHVDNDQHSCKRRRLNDSFPSTISFIPKLQHPVQPLTSPSLHLFTQHANLGRPFHLRDTLQHWPALELWSSPKYWLDGTVQGTRLVPVEIGQSYHDAEWKQELMPFKRFFDEFILPEKPKEMGYLAQHDLFRQMPVLRKDIAIPDYCYADIIETAPETGPGGDCASKDHTGASVSKSPNLNHIDQADDISEIVEDRQVHTNIWFGGFTTTPLHHDPYHNILAQVHGTKYVRMYDPKYTSRLYPRSKTEPAPHSRVDPEIAESKDRESLKIESGVSPYSPRDLSASSESTTFEQSAGPNGIVSYTLKPDPKSESTPIPEPDLVIPLHAKSSTTTTSSCETINMSNNSYINIYDIELSPHEDWDEIWPGLSTVPYVECILEKGDALYIPKGWWHYVRSCSVGVSVSFWW